MSFHVSLVHNCSQALLASLSFLFLQRQAVHEELALLEALDFETFGGLRVQIAQLHEDFTVEAHDSELFDIGIDTQVFHKLLVSVAIGHKWAEFHPWVQVKDELVLSKDCMPRDQHCRVVDLVLAFEFQSWMVQAKGALHSEVDLCHFVLGTNKAHAA